MCRRILKHCFKDKLLARFTMYGTSNKQPFNVFKEVLSTIYMAVTKKFPGTTNHELDTWFKNYVKFATNRIKISHNKKIRLRPSSLTD